MRDWKTCVPMITLCLLLTACGGAEKTEDLTAELRDRYHDMSGCAMVAEVSCDQDGALWTATLQCDYIPGGESTVEVLAPETIAGVRAVLKDEDWQLEYEDACLDAGTLGSQEVSPAVCLPRLINALRDGWLLEENREEWNEVPCLRLTVDQSGARDGKILSTVWLRLDDGTPLRGEIVVDGKNILTAEFTQFAFYDMMEQQTPEDRRLAENENEGDLNGRERTAPDLGGDQSG